MHPIAEKPAPGDVHVMLKYIQIETETGYNRYSYGRGGIQVHRVL
jgi:hypothetical protein